MIKYLIFIMFLIGACCPGAVMDLYNDPPNTAEEAVALFDDMSDSEQKAICGGAKMYCAGILTKDIKYLISGPEGLLLEVNYYQDNSTHTETIELPWVLDLEDVYSGTPTRLEVSCIPDAEYPETPATIKIEIYSNGYAIARSTIPYLLGVHTTLNSHAPF